MPKVSMLMIWYLEWWWFMPPQCVIVIWWNGGGEQVWLKKEKWRNWIELIMEAVYPSVWKRISKFWCLPLRICQTVIWLIFLNNIVTNSC